jgi:hypothetical protein
MNDDEARQSPAATSTDAVETISRHGSHKTAPELLKTDGALLSRSHLRELGLERRAIDAVFRECPVVALPGYARTLIKASDYLELLEACTFSGDRVRPA